MRIFGIAILLSLLLVITGGHGPGAANATAASGSRGLSYRQAEKILFTYLTLSSGVAGFEVMEWGLSEDDPENPYYWIQCAVDAPALDKKPNPAQGIPAGNSPPAGMPAVKSGGEAAWPRIPNVFPEGREEGAQEGLQTPQRLLATYHIFVNDERVEWHESRALKP